MATADSTRRKALPTATYFYRRFRRIYPPYWIWFALVGLIVELVEAHLQPGFFDDSLSPLASPLRLAPWQWVGNLSLTEVWRSHVVGGPQAMYLAHAWTLCYEEQFYAVAGLALVFFRRRFFEAFILITLGVVALKVVAYSANLDVLGFFFDGRWLIFAGGIIVYYVLLYANGRERRLWCGVLATGLLYSLRRHRDLLVMAPNDFNQSLFVACAFSLSLVFLHQYDDAVAKSRWLRPINWCGTMCYSLYLVHWPLVKVVSKLLANVGLHSYAQTLFITIPVCLAVALLVSRAFHVVVERRFLNSSM